MVDVHTSGAVYRGFEPQSDQTKDNKIGFCCFSAKHTECVSVSDMSICGLLFNLISTRKIELSMLV